MTLNNVTDKIRVVLSGAVTTNQLECVVLFNNSSTPALSKSRVLTETNNTTPVDLLVGQQGTTSLSITSISIYNSDTVNARVTVSYYNGTNEFIFVKQLLAPGETLQYNQSQGFFLDSSTVALPTGAATSAKQDTGNTSLSSIDTKLTIKPFSIDAAFRQRMSLQTTLGEYKMLNNVFASLILEKVGTGTFTDNTNRVTMSVTSGQYAIIRSKLFHPYFNGKSHLIELTTAAMGTASNVEKSIAYISSTAVSPYATGLDGFRLFKSTADVYSIQVWRNGTNTINVLRSSWYDKLDGTGASGMTINWDNFNVFFFDFLYLGGTALRVFCMYNGEPILVNVYYYSNSDTTPIFLSPNKEIRYELRSTTGSGSLDFICGMVSTEGAGQEEGTTITINAPNAGITPLATGTTYALCGVRKASTQRDIFAEIKSFEGVISTNDFINLELRLNPTVAGTFNYSALTNTPLETATGAITNTVTGGTVIANTYFSLNMNNSKEVKSILAQLNSTINNTMDTIVLCATPALGSNNVKVTGSMMVQWFNQ